MIANMLIERDLIRSCAPAPPALAVANLVDDDAEDPGAKRRLAAESMKRAEHPKKHFLRQVERLFAIAKQVRGETQHEPVMFADQGRVSDFVARQAPLDQRGLAAGHFGPRNGFSRLDGEISCHRVPPDYNSF